MNADAKSYINNSKLFIQDVGKCHFFPSFIIQTWKRQPCPLRHCRKTLRYGKPGAPRNHATQLPSYPATQLLSQSLRQPPCPQRVGSAMHDALAAGNGSLASEHIDLVLRAGSLCDRLRQLVAAFCLG